MENIRNVLAKNLIKFRKAMNLTQADLANKLNYSDKAISKWERGESLPDVEILYELSKLFNVSIDTLLTDDEKIVEKVVKGTKMSKAFQNALIIMLSILVVWVVATILFVTFSWFGSNDTNYLVFIYAIPVSFIVYLVLNSVLGKAILNPFIVAGLLWSLCLAIHLQFINVEDIWYVYIVGIPLQVCDIVWYILLKVLHHQKKRILK